MPRVRTGLWGRLWAHLDPFVAMDSYGEQQRLSHEACVR